MIEVEAMYSDAGIAVGFTMPRTPSTGKASRAWSVALKAPFLVMAGRNLHLITSSRG